MRLRQYPKGYIITSRESIHASIFNGWEMFCRQSLSAGAISDRVVPLFSVPSLVNIGLTLSSW